MTQTKSSLLQNKHSSEAGFTLVELAIVIIILGILLAAFFFGLTIFLKQKQAEDERTRFDDITIAMSKFVFDEPEVDADNDGTPDNIYDSDGDNVLDSPNDPVRYPCPARLTLPPTDAGYGRERCPTAAEIAGLSAGDELGGAGGGIFALSGTGGNLVLIGAIPAATIGESTDIMVDEFGNLIFYAVSLNVMNGDSALLTDPGPGAIIILDANGNPRTITSNFAIFSAGEDGAGAYSSFGVPNGTPCRTPGTAGAGDSQNCLWQTTNIATFRQQLGRTDGLNLAATDDFYDDRLVFTFRNEDDDEGWWVATDDSGTDITHKNDGNVLINLGSNIGVGNTSPIEEIQVTAPSGSGLDANVLANNAGVGTGPLGTHAYLLGDGALGVFRPTDAVSAEAAANQNGYIDMGIGTGAGEKMRIWYDYADNKLHIGDLRNADTTFQGNVGIFPGNAFPPDPGIALFVDGETNINGNTGITGNTTINGNTGITGNTTINGGMFANGNSGIGTTSPNATFDVDGEVKVGNTGTACVGSNRGALRYNSGRDQMEFCSASGWRSTSSPAPGDCTVRTFNGGAGGVTGTCNANEYLVSGGGECDTINGNTTGLGYFHYNRPSGGGNSWTTDCFSPVSSVAQNVSGSTGSEDGLSGDHSHSFNINVPSDTASAGNPNSTVSIICCKR